MMEGSGLGFGWIFQLLFWALIIWLIMSLARRHRSGGCCGMGHEEKRDNALDILRERYAKGDITKEDFDRMKKDLG